MTNLLWPGDQRAGALLTDAALLDAMVAVEAAWLTTLAGAGLAPEQCADVELAGLLAPADAEHLARAAEESGNPVVPLVALLRERADAHAGGWIHRGLTSQDVLDTALMLSIRDAVGEIRTQLAAQLSAAVRLTTAHRDTPMVARTLTQHAVPTTFGAKAAGWLTGIADAVERLDALSIPAQFGGAAGTLAATTELAALAGRDDPAAEAVRLAQLTASALGLAVASPWQTTRGTITAIGDALVTCTDAWGRIAGDITTLARPEIGELDEPAGSRRGASSTMPDKRNPVLAILIRRAAIVAPPLAATLHTAAALTHDERPAGAWHAEWDTLRTLARRSVVAGAHCTELLAGLQVHPQRMAENLADANVLGEQRAMSELVGKPPSPSYFGAVGQIIDAAVQRAERLLAHPPAEPTPPRGGT